MVFPKKEVRIQKLKLFMLRSPHVVSNNWLATYLGCFITIFKTGKSCVRVHGNHFVIFTAGFYIHYI
jgi:hypothetical protein